MHETPLRMHKRKHAIDRQRRRQIFHSYEHQRRHFAGAASHGQNHPSHDARQSAGEHDAAKRREPSVSIDHGRLLEIDGDLTEEAFHHPDHDRHVERGVDDDEAQLGVQQPELLRDQEDRDDDHDRRQQTDHQQGEAHVPMHPERQPEARKDICRLCAERQRDRHAQRRDDHRVREVGAELPAAEQAHVVAGGQRLGDERCVLCDLAVALDRGQEHPDERRDRKQERGQGRAGPTQPPKPVARHLPRLRIKPTAKPDARITTIATMNSIAAAYPTCWNWKNVW